MQEHLYTKLFPIFPNVSPISINFLSKHWHIRSIRSLSNQKQEYFHNRHIPSSLTHSHSLTHFCLSAETFRKHLCKRPLPSHPDSHSFLPSKAYQLIPGHSDGEVHILGTAVQTFMAYILPVSAFLQPYTSPNPPRPMIRCTKKGYK